jgi:hypothetical protein
MTIEPTAIQVEMPVNALIGFKNVGQLRKSCGLEKTLIQ